MKNPKVTENYFDVIIIGAGVVGVLIAKRLCDFDASVAVIEKNNYICWGQSKGNGSIIHSGHNEVPGTLKAHLCVRGNRMFPGLCRELGLKFNKTGYIVLAFNESELNKLKKLETQSNINGARVRIIDRNELLFLEPNVSKKAIAALYVIDAAIIDVFRLVIAAAEYSAVNKVSFIFSSEVTGLEKENKSFIKIKTDKNTFYSRVAINCCGADSGRIMQAAGDEPVKIKPRRGEYYILDKSEKGLVQRPVYMVPTDAGKGILVFPSENGNIIFGGNSETVYNSSENATTMDGFNEVYKESLKIAPCLDSEKIIASFAGVRSSIESRDFFIRQSVHTKGLINICGIDSPGLSSSPAIAEYAVDMVKKHISLVKRRDGLITRYKIDPLLRDLADENKNILINKDSHYGRIICRCENITEGDIVASINAPIPANTMDAIKFRTKAQAGRCQGSFCISRILEILHRETGMDYSDILKNNLCSQIIKGNTKYQKC